MTALEKRCDTLLTLEKELLRYSESEDWEMTCHVLKDMSDTITTMRVFVEMKQQANKWLLENMNK